MRMIFMSMLFLALFATPGVFAGEGLVSVDSSTGAKETADRVERLVKERGMTLVTRIDHAKAARTVGMDLRPTEVLIFGNPRAGTPLMLCKQETGIDLPLKVLVWQDEAGTVKIGYTDPAELKGRYGIRGCDEVLRKMSAFLKALAADASRPGP